MITYSFIYFNEYRSEQVYIYIHVSVMLNDDRTLFHLLFLLLFFLHFCCTINNCGTVVQLRTTLLKFAFDPSPVCLADQPLHCLSHWTSSPPQYHLSLPQMPWKEKVTKFMQWINGNVNTRIANVCYHGVLLLTHPSCPFPTAQLALLTKEEEQSHQEEKQQNAHHHGNDDRSRTSLLCLRWEDRTRRELVRGWRLMASVKKWWVWVGEEEKGEHRGGTGVLRRVGRK